MTFQVHGPIRCLLSPCKQQATKTELQAAAKLDVNVGQSANSLQIVTQQKEMFQTIKVIPSIYKYKLNEMRDGAQHNRSQNALLEKGEKACLL